VIHVLISALYKYVCMYVRFNNTSKTSGHWVPSERQIQYNRKRIYNVPISLSKKPESEAREATYWE